MLMELANAGKSVIVVSDDISEMMNLTNRIYIMKNGRIAQTVDTAEVDASMLEDAISS